ncbi:AcrR family transcriptional regulator [Rhodococcus sp. 27YEA15]|uniref:TetR/AcrR family transcriptional regulator n=1 Tax=Rhodococcus sp. 27YEA15 TaxID=3156259 RepID=UPI003C7CFF3A
MGRARVKPAPGPAITSRGKRTREALVQAGREVLEQRGWAGFSVESVAQAAGVSHGTFYTHLESKEALLQEVVRAVAAEMFAASLLGPEISSAPYTRIVESNRRYLRAWSKASKVLRLVEQGADTSESLRRMVLEIRELYVRRGTESLVQLRDAGLVTVDLDPTLTAICLGAMVEQVAHVMFSSDEPLDEDVVVEHLSRLWASAIGLKIP